jgi:hypothetical protein
MAHQVFICHSSLDKAVADAACAVLESEGISCWIAPRDVPAGEEWGKSIIEALSGCSVLILIFSSNANDSPQVRREVERAVSKRKIIVPFRIEDLLPSDAMEYALSNTHWLDAITPPMESHLSELVRATARLLEQGESEHHGEGASILGRSTASGRIQFRAWGWVAALVLVVASVALALPRIGRELGWWRGSGGITDQTQTGQDLSAMEQKARELYTEKKFSEAFLLAKASCDKGVAGGCTYAGLMYDRGEGIAKDEGQAVSFYRKGCDGGDPMGCRDLALMYRTGTGVAQDNVQAVELYRKDCDAGDVIGCTNLGLMYANGAGVRQDDKRAFALFRQACDAGESYGCYDLASVYADGIGVAKDEAQAMKLYRKACSSGNQPACDLVKTGKE